MFALGKTKDSHSRGVATECVRAGRERQLLAEEMHGVGGQRDLVRPVSTGHRFVKFVITIER